MVDTTENSDGREEKSAPAHTGNALPVLEIEPYLARMMDSGKIGDGALTPPSNHFQAILQSASVLPNKLPGSCCGATTPFFNDIVIVLHPIRSDYGSSARP
jgi:hypothetical protein